MDTKTILHMSPRTIHRLRKVQALIDQLDPDTAPQALVVPGSPQPQGDIIVFPGSFNPPTTAHLALLKQARQFARQKRLSAGKGKGAIHLYAAMSKRTTDKENVERPLMLDRIMLLRLLLRRRLPHAGIMLFNRGLYVEQAEAIRAAFPKVKRLFFLVGFDKIVQILDPRYYENRDKALHDLFALAEFLVAPRGDAGPGALSELLQKPENQQFARYIHSLPFSSAYRDISSTQLRQNLEAHAHETPQEVRRFMRETRAYAPPLQLPDGSEIDYYGERVKALKKLVSVKAGK